MAPETLPANVLSTLTDQPNTEQASPSQGPVKRRSFLKGLGVVGAALSTGSLLTTISEAQGRNDVITVGDVAILRFLAAAEILETDLWQQYNELGGVQEAAAVVSTLRPWKFSTEICLSTFTTIPKTK